MSREESDFLNERTRAEDILLGSLGLGEDAHFLSATINSAGYSVAVGFSDGEQATLNSEGEISALERWALEVLGVGVVAKSA